MQAIEISSLAKSFGAQPALAGVSLTVAPGEMVALIGASGSGKSTLIRHVAGLLAGDRATGSVQVLGRPVQHGGRLARGLRALRCEIGVIFQQFNLVGRLSLLTNVLLGTLGRVPVWRGSLGLFSDAEKLEAMAALQRVGMAGYAGQRASTLSGGQQQRAAIARCLVQRARLVLADEPIASLDPASAKRVMEMLAEINREDGITVVVSLHQVDYAIRYCRRVVALRDGKVVYDGPTTALTRAFLHELYGTSSEELLLSGAVDETEPATAPDESYPEAAVARAAG
ncbi:phosphonate transport system ATP-binding protein [Tistlia consotensis]|uniref:Phosphonate transport system ATP-binding protein n=1 Tax=Tistlia consotensis USBA 355 TaxID=560819 RepID=A0A1Y6BQA8_9PROT|nr:phosphonate ABC transporter ATP-binding protein [Tistlia consotensis]SMF21746.1 phosphonate transport system ATP-binding protein [Tistlia consotensis USBA 355]SNR46608.1 phosphonate transport system ATP-binding protein [Tistlia consotensis]